jgi:hypothetical protein
MPCPLCEEFDVAESEHNSKFGFKKKSERTPAENEAKAKDRARFKNLEATLAYVYALKVNDGPLQLFAASEFKFERQIQTAINNKKARNPKIVKYADDFEGYSMFVTISKTVLGGIGRPFAMITAVDFEPRSEVDQATLDAVPKLDEIFIVKSYNELKDLMLCTESENEQPEQKEKEIEAVPEQVKEVRSKRRPVSTTNQ